MILSHGANGLGAYTEQGQQRTLPPGVTAAESLNANNGLAFVRTDYSEQPGNYFDDIVMVLSPDDLLAPLIKDGSLASARAVTQKELELLRDKIVAGIVVSVAPHNIPATGTVTNMKDGWGTDISITRGPSADVCGGAMGITAFTVTSAGPDQDLVKTADNIPLPQDNDQLKAYFFKSGTPCP